MKTLFLLLHDHNQRLVVVVIFTLVLLSSLFGPMDLETYPNKMKVGLDFLVAIKLLITATTGIVAFLSILNHHAVRQALTTLPALLISCILGLTCIGGISGVSSAAIPTAAINYVNLVFVLMAITFIGLRVFSLGVILGVLCAMVYALYLYYFVPERGTFTEPAEFGTYIVRMGGVGHPNSVARSTIVSILLTIYLYRAREFSLIVAMFILFLFVWVGCLTMSRTALIAGVVGGAMLFADRLTLRAVVTVVVGTCVAGLLGLSIFVAAGNEDRVFKKVIGMVSKTEDGSDLVTGTGRTVIWAEAFSFIAKRPLRGYGLNSAPVLLVDHSQSTHNAVMNATLSGGVFAGLAMTALLAWNAWNAVNSANLLVRCLCAFLFLSCLTEDTVLETFPGPCTLLWYVCLFVPVLPPKDVQFIDAGAHMSTDA